MKLVDHARGGVKIGTAVMKNHMYIFCTLEVGNS